MSKDQKALQEFLKRRHPDYQSRLSHWDFLDAAYEGGREWFDTNIFRYIKEGDREFADRISRAYRFNHTREAVDLVNKYIFKIRPSRKQDAPEELLQFWKNATLGGLDVDQFMKTVSTRSSISGRVWIFADTNKRHEVLSRADEKEAQVRVYAYTVKQQDVLDMGFDEMGRLTWILVREFERDDVDPIESTGKVKERFRLWEPDRIRLFEIDVEKNKVFVRVSETVNELGRIPAFPVDHALGEHRYVSPGLIDDIAYLDRAVANYLSNLDAIIQDQTFSQLAMPAQGLLPGDDKFNQLLDMGTKRIFTYDGEGGGKPEFISPDAAQAGVILSVINKIINEIYHTIGMAGERTKQDNAVGVDNSSGVAKAYDFERMNSLLTAKASSLETAENRLAELVLAYHRKPLKENVVTYPETFDVRGLYDEFSIAEQLMMVDAPKAIRREQMNQVVEKLFPQLKAEVLKKIKKDIEGWLEMPEGDLLGAPLPKSVSDPARRNATTRDRQGEVTSETG
jgi:hypothetical protein